MKEESGKAGLKVNIQKMKIMASSPITSWHIDGETMERVTEFIFFTSKITENGGAMQLKATCSLEAQHIEKQRLYFANKGLSSQGYVFSSSHIWMWELDYKESWAPQN